MYNGPWMRACAHRRQTDVNWSPKLADCCHLMLQSSGSGHFPPGHTPRTFPFPDNSTPFYTVEDIPPFHRHHTPIYNIKRFTVNVYKIG